MKKLLTLSAAVLISGMVTTSALAHQDSSFTNITTFGMFETMYDFYKYSPAYLPSFEKSALWTQLSNLQNASDELFDWTGTARYMIGFQTDIMGMGRGGAMADWYSYIEAVNFTNFAGDSGNGEVESTRTDYRDLDNDEIIDFSEVRHGRQIRENRYFDNDIYLVFGMGDVAGFALGASIRMDWYSYQPTWNDWDGDVSMDREWSRKQYSIDPLGNRNQTYNQEGKQEGSFNYGNSMWEIKLGARNDQLIPGIDLVGNVGVVINSNTNELDFQYNETTTPDLASPLTTIQTNISEKGIEPGTLIYPGSGLGFLVELRGDMALSQEWTFIPEAGFAIIPTSIDGEQERIDQTLQTAPTGIGPSIDNYDWQKDKWEGNTSDLMVNAKTRFVYQGPGWRLGLGARGYITSESTDRTQTFEESDTYTYTLVQGASNPASDYVTTVVSGSKTETMIRNVYNTLELPIGLELPIVENAFVTYFGAIHRVTLNSFNTTTKRVSLDNQVTTQTYRDGTVITTINDVVDDQSGYEETEITSTHDTDFMAGFSWFPAENMRIDAKNVFRHEYWRDWEISFNFFF